MSYRWHCEHNSLTSGLPLMLTLTFGYGHHKGTTHTLTAASHSSYPAAASLRCFSVCPTRPRQPRATAVRPGAEWVGECTLPAGYGHSAKAPRSVHTWYPNGSIVFDQVTRQLIQPVPGRPTEGGRRCDPQSTQEHLASNIQSCLLNNRTQSPRTYSLAITPALLFPVPP